MYAFKVATEIQIIEVYDEVRDEISSECVERFEAGEKFDADLIEGSKAGHVDLQFEDGSMAFNIPKKSLIYLKG